MQHRKIPKTEQVRQAVQSGDFPRAIAIAKTFRALPSATKTALVRAHEARVFPHFFTQIGKDPDHLWSEGVAVVTRLYGGHK